MNRPVALIFILTGATLMIASILREGHTFGPIYFASMLNLIAGFTLGKD